MELEIVYMNPCELKPYENNTRKHTPEDIDQIKESIQKDGFNDPIGIWGKDNLIVEGHGRQIAAMEMGIDRVPCIRLDHMTDTQRRDYAIRHNRTAELSGWNFETLEKELKRLEAEGVDLSGLGFETNFGGQAEETQEKYSKATDIPQYTPSDEMPNINQLVNTEKVDDLIKEIDGSGVSDAEKQFLRMAAYRHAVIDFDRVADYYAGASEEMQELMERSALVIIDYQDAIRNGYATLNATIADIMGVDEDE